MNYEEVSIPTICHESGMLSVIESGIDLPFEFRRVYFLHSLAEGAIRGGHAHRALHQLLFVPSGSLDLSLNDGNTSITLTMKDPTKGIWLKPPIWRDIDKCSKDATLIVLASDHYDESDYIRNFDDFKQYCESK